MVAAIELYYGECVGYGVGDRQVVYFLRVYDDECAGAELVVSGVPLILDRRFANQKQGK